MKYGLVTNAIFGAVLALMVLTAKASESEHSVVIEVVTNGMTADKVEENIANPIELLMSGLTDVLLISAKYQENEAEITVKFNQKAAEQAGLVDRVREVLDNNMERLPQDIVTLSVSLSSLLPNNPDDKIREAAPRSYEGSYLGRIQSSNELLPIITTFFKKNHLAPSFSGSYFMNEVKTIVKGSLSDCEQETDYVVGCQWKDKYGSGDVAFTFADDYTHFNAKWSIVGHSADFKWTGVAVSVASE